ncbi:MAG: NUDIX hydrolase [Verrucomicrobiota bacterium]|nr:NUDIX hydrolase [Verrucomicrobiota bacterium]
MKKLIHILFIIFYQIKKVVDLFYKFDSRGVYIAVWHKDRILIIKNSYKNDYVIPCGGVKRKESFLEGAIRELREEVNIQTTPEDLILVKDVLLQQSPKYSGKIYEIHFSEEPTFKPDGLEVVWAEFKTIPEALKMPLDSTIKDYLEKQGKCS